MAELIKNTDPMTFVLTNASECSMNAIKFFNSNSNQLVRLLQQQTISFIDLFRILFWKNDDKNFTKKNLCLWFNEMITYLRKTKRSKPNQTKRVNSQQETNEQIRYIRADLFTIQAGLSSLFHWDVCRHTIMASSASSIYYELCYFQYCRLYCWSWRPTRAEYLGVQCFITNIMFFQLVRLIFLYFIIIEIHKLLNLSISIWASRLNKERFCPFPRLYRFG